MFFSENFFDPPKRPQKQAYIYHFKITPFPRPYQTRTVCTDSMQ